MGKHTDQIGKIEDYQAPWETAAGETEIDKDKLKRYIFNLSLDKAKAQDARDDAAGLVTEAEQKVKDAQDELAKADSSGTTADLQKKLDKALENEKVAKVALTRYEVATEKGLTPAQAKYLQGETDEELKASADSILEDFGVKPTTHETDEEREEREEREQEEADEATNARQSPVIRKGLVNPADPNGEQVGEPDYAKVVAGWDRRVI